MMHSSNGSAVLPTLLLDLRYSAWCWKSKSRLMGNSDWGHCLVKFYNNWMQQLLKILICTINLLKQNKTKREKSLINIFYNLHHRHKLKNKEMYLLDWMSECLAHWKDKTDRMAQLVEGQTEKPGAILMIRVWFPSGSVTRDFTPRINFQCRLCYSVCTTPLCNAR